jgi:hypothetical protein
MQLDKLPDIMFFKSAAFEFVTTVAISMLEGEVLEGAFPGLVAYRAIERMVDQKEFHNRFSCVQYFFGGIILYFHPILALGTA